MEKIVWVDRVTSKESTYFVENNEDGTIKLIPDYGEVIEEGTKLNADNLNAIYDYIDAQGSSLLIPLVTSDIENPQDGEIWIRTDLLGVV